jgi:predicted transcriptional regulator
MPRKRINIDISDELDGRLAAIADRYKASKTEVARALLDRHAIPTHAPIAHYIKQNREEANRARSQTQTAHRQAPQESDQPHPEKKR